MRTQELFAHFCAGGLITHLPPKKIKNDTITVIGSYSKPYINVEVGHGHVLLVVRPLLGDDLHLREGSLQSVVHYPVAISRVKDPISHEMLDPEPFRQTKPR